MANKPELFGSWLREKRLARGYTLRKFAEQVGISPTYLSHVEQNIADPPTADRVKTMAVLLGENADEMIALAGRVPEDLPEIIQRQPIRITALIREVCDLSEDQLQELIDDVRKKKR